MLNKRSDLTWAWKLALVSFVIAGSTGALLRYAMIVGAPWGLHLQDMRHAHSHLMYFGWVTPALMALILSKLEQVTGRSTAIGARRVVGATIALALLAYASFLFYGYRPASIANRQLPLSTIAAGMNIFAWYAFTYAYWRETRHVARRLTLRLWDAALIFMVVSSLGAWGLAITTVMGVGSPLLSSALTHLFLDLFADGWFLLALLGLAFAAIPASAAGKGAGPGENLLVIGLPLTFFLSVPGSLLPVALRVLAGLSALIAAMGLFLLLMSLFRNRNTVSDSAQRCLWTVVIVFLGLKAVAFLVVSVPAGAAWSLRMGLRVSYLHWLLLGGVSIGLIAAARHRWGPSLVSGWWMLLSTVIVLIVSLIPLTGLWPTAWKGRWVFEAAAWAALGPVLAALYMLLSGYWTSRAGRKLHSVPDAPGLQSGSRR